MRCGRVVTNRLIKPSQYPYPSPPHPSTQLYRMQIILMKIRTDFNNMDMVKTYDGGRIEEQYPALVKVFSKVTVKTVPPHTSTNHVINPKLGYKSPFRQIYKVAQFDLKTLKAYNEINRASDFIQWLPSLAAAPILFAKKRDRGLQLCVNYPALNLGTIRNCYIFPLISEILD